MIHRFTRDNDAALFSTVCLLIDWQSHIKKWKYSLH